MAISTGIKWSRTNYPALAILLRLAVKANMDTSSYYAKSIAPLARMMLGRYAKQQAPVPTEKVCIAALEFLSSSDGRYTMDDPIVLKRVIEALTAANPTHTNLIGALLTVAAERAEGWNCRAIVRALDQRYT